MKNILSYQCGAPFKGYEILEWCNYQINEHTSHEKEATRIYKKYGETLDPETTYFFYRGEERTRGEDVFLIKKLSLSMCKDCRYQYYKNKCCFYGDYDGENCNRFMPKEKEDYVTREQFRIFKDKENELYEKYKDSNDPKAYDKLKEEWLEFIRYFIIEKDEYDKHEH